MYDTTRGTHDADTPVGVSLFIEAVNPSNPAAAQDARHLSEVMGLYLDPTHARRLFNESLRMFREGSPWYHAIVRLHCGATSIRFRVEPLPGLKEETDLIKMELSLLWDSPSSETERTMIQAFLNAWAAC